MRDKKKLTELLNELKSLDGGISRLAQDNIIRGFAKSGNIADMIAWLKEAEVGNMKQKY